MSRHLKITIGFLAGLALLPALGADASAIEIITPTDSNALLRQGRGNELRALRNQIQRQQFQQQQQQNRTQDRRVAPPPVLDVPKMKPTCQKQVYGNGYLKSCR
ncbi:MAG TPA: hypothetical protein VGM46_02185 [Mesorhizobium sp.]